MALETIRTYKKHPVSILFYDVDFRANDPTGMTPQLEADERIFLIQSMTVSPPGELTIIEGPEHSGRIQGDKMVRVWVSGGLNGGRYYVTVLIETSGSVKAGTPPRTYPRTFIVDIEGTPIGVSGDECCTPEPIDEYNVLTVRGGEWVSDKVNLSSPNAIEGLLDPTYIEPGTNAYVLTTVAGVPTWAPAGFGAASPGGVSTNVQYNNGGAFAGASQINVVAINAFKFGVTPDTVGIGHQRIDHDSTYLAGLRLDTGVSRLIEWGVVDDDVLTLGASGITGLQLATKSAGRVEVQFNSSTLYEFNNDRLAFGARRATFGSAPAATGAIGVSDNMVVMKGLRASGGLDIPLLSWGVAADDIFEIGSSSVEKNIVNAKGVGETDFQFNSTTRHFFKYASFQSDLGAETDTAPPNGWRLNAAAHISVNAGSEIRDVTLNLNRTVSIDAGTISNQRSIRVNPVTLTGMGGAVNVSGKTATLSIQGPPAASGAGGNTPTFANLLAVEIEAGALGFGDCPDTGLVRVPTSSDFNYKHSTNGTTRFIGLGGDISFGDFATALTGGTSMYFDAGLNKAFVFRVNQTDVAVFDKNSSVGRFDWNAGHHIDSASFSQTGSPASSGWLRAVHNTAVLKGLQSGGGGDRTLIFWGADANALQLGANGGSATEAVASLYLEAVATGAHHVRCGATDVMVVDRDKILVADSNTPPTTNPPNPNAYWYVEDGETKVRGPDGTVTTVASR